jgi:ADP-ribose pyrophosphatase YjhB (NUDIX family)
MSVCDHTSVGMVVIRNKKLLLIERMKFPFGFAPAAGHVDGDSDYEESAVRELSEEVGLTATSLELLYEGRKENHCRREDGTWHYWKVYHVETTGNISRSLDETKQAKWYSKKDLQKMVKRTEDYLAGKIAEEDWRSNPGFETVWYGFLVSGEVDLYSLL